MELTIVPREGILQINNARIMHVNFSGKVSEFNRSGDRGFSLIIDSQEIADELIAQGYNVKIKPPRDVDGEPLMYLPVKVKYSGYRNPNIYLVTGQRVNKLDEETVNCLDNIRMAEINMDIRPYDWVVQKDTPNEKRGRAAYLQSLEVVQEMDRFSERYSENGSMFTE